VYIKQVRRLWVFESCTLYAYTSSYNARQRDYSGHLVRRFDCPLSACLLPDCRHSTRRSSLDSIHQVAHTHIYKLIKVPVSSHSRDPEDHGVGADLQSPGMTAKADV